MREGPFRGSRAIAGGDLTRGELRSRRFRQVFRDVYVPTCPDPLGLETLSRAAFLLLGPDGALAGYSAAVLLGVDCAPRGAPAEVLSPGTGIRARPGLLVHRGALAAGQVWTVRGCRVTNPLRTAWDLARRLPRTDAVVAVDALARRGRFDPAALLAPGRSGDCGRRRVPEVVALAHPAAESPMESRLRLVLVEHGLPAPVVQYPLLDRDGCFLARFDLAYPQARLAIEYDGAEFHRDRRGADNHRDIDVAEYGWETMRFEAPDILGTPARTADAVRRLLDLRLPAASRQMPR